MKIKNKIIERISKEISVFIVNFKIKGRMNGANKLLKTETRNPEFMSPLSTVKSPGVANAAGVAASRIKAQK